MLLVSGIVGALDFQDTQLRVGGRERNPLFPILVFTPQLLQARWCSGLLEPRY